ncbi:MULTISPECIES: hypothetical protein [unclassified Blastococcus]
MPTPLESLRTACTGLSRVLLSLGRGEGWAPTGCTGWAVVDLGHQLLQDARRALVALAAPAGGPADTTAAVLAVLAAAGAGRRGRALGDPGRGQPARRLRRGAAQPRRGRVLSLLSTLTVEAAVHHLDLVAHLDRPGPAAGPLAEVRRVLEGLLGQPLPGGWDDATRPAAAPAASR